RHVCRLTRAGGLAAEHLCVEATGALHVVGNDEVGQRDLICGLAAFRHLVPPWSGSGTSSRPHAASLGEPPALSGSKASPALTDPAPPSSLLLPWRRAILRRIPTPAPTPAPT